MFQRIKNTIKLLLIGVVYLFVVTTSNYTQNAIIIFNATLLSSILVYLFLQWLKEYSVVNLFVFHTPLIIVLCTLNPQYERLITFVLPIVLGHISMYFFFKKEIYYKITTTILLILIICSASFYFIPEYIYFSSLKKVEKRVSTFKLKNEKGEILDYTELKGKVIFIDFFTTYCGNCIRNFPKVEKLREEYEGNSNVVFLYVDVVLSEHETYDLFSKDVPKYQKHFNLKIPFYYDINKQLGTQLKINGVPIAVIIDKKGNVNYEYGGAPKEDKFAFHKNMKHIIDELLEE